MYGGDIECNLVSSPRCRVGSKKTSSQKGTTTQSSHPRNQTMHTGIYQFACFSSASHVSHTVRPGIEKDQLHQWIFENISTQHILKYRLSQQDNERVPVFYRFLPRLQACTHAAAGLPRETAEPNGIEPCKKGVIPEYHCRPGGSRRMHPGSQTH